MPIFEIKSPEGETFEINGPEGSTLEQAVEKAKQMQATRPTAGRFERIGQGLADPIYGAAQIGARMSTEGEGMLESIVGGEDADSQRAARSRNIDRIIKQREQEIQSRRPAEDRGSIDWLRAGGAIPTTMALTAPSLAMGPIAGGAIAGASGAMLQPETDTENFVTQKAKEAVTGGVGGAVIGGLAKGAAAIYQSLRNPTAKAMSELERAAVRDGTTLEKLQQRLTEAQAIRPEATLADVAGTNVRGVVERIGQTPGAGSAKLEDRFMRGQREQFGRLKADLSELSNVGQRAVDVIPQVIQRRTLAAAPLYQRAYADGDRAIWSNGLNQLTSIPQVQAAMRRAVSNWQLSQGAAGYGALNPRGIGSNFRVVGEFNVGQPFEIPTGRVPVFPDLQFWDYTKGALDSMIEKQIKPDGTLTRIGRELTITTRRLRDELDQAVPSYRAARQAWAGETAYLNAIRLGSGIMSENSEEMAAAFGRMTTPEQEAYRIGAVSSIRAALGKDSAKLADFTKKLRSPEMQAKIMAMMPSPEAAQRWVAILAAEERSSELTTLALKGSPTARRLAQQADADTMIGDIILTTLHGIKDPTSLALWGKILGALPKKVRDTLRSRTDAVMADILTTPEGATTASGTIPSAGNPALERSSGPLSASYQTVTGELAGDRAPE